MSWESNLLGSKRMIMQNLFSIWISHGALNFKTTRSFTSFPPSPPPPTAVSNNIFPSKYRSQGTHQRVSVISHYFSRQQVKILLRSLLWEGHYIQRVSELTNISEIFIASFWSVTIFWNLMIKHKHKKNAAFDSCHLLCLSVPLLSCQFPRHLLICFFLLQPRMHLLPEINTKSISEEIFHIHTKINQMH